ncbi:hypothetical protein HY933_00455 [Candidatus Falkowbacteria bacterium]|nr:hypothetical protein [Candidatus Falkowbacteria bacterium]
MEERSQKLLNSLIKEHIKTAEPIGSQLLVDKYKLGVSPATVRTVLAELEADGYIHQPHTSAGRVPTEKAYRFYVDHFLSSKDVKESEQKLLEAAFKKLADQPQPAIKELAKHLAELSDSLVFVGFGPYDLYYTGLSNIFSQPEFRDSGVVYDLSRVVDHLDDVMVKVFMMDMAELQIMIGSRNPFGNMCSAVVSRYQFGSDERGVFGLLGPLRMDYDGNVGLVTYVKELIGNL